MLPGTSGANSYSLRLLDCGSPVVVCTLQTIVTNAQHFTIFYSYVVFEEFCLRNILYSQTGTDRPAKLTVTAVA